MPVIRNGFRDDVFINEYLMVCDAMIYVFVHDDVMIILMLLINASDL